MSVTTALLEPLLREGSARPLITHYDDATGARIELSRATTANWAAKTANWLVDECDVEPGTAVSVALPPHWQTVGVVLGAWWCGAHVTNDPNGAEVAFVPGTDLEAGRGAHLVAALSLDPMGAGVRDLPDSAVDYVSDIRIHGDDFSPLLPIPGDTPALLGYTVDQLVTRCRQRADELTLADADRIMSTKEWTLPDGMIDGLLAGLAAGASLVQCNNPDPAKLERRRVDEKITTELTD